MATNMQKRKYKVNDRKKIIEKITNIKNKDILIDIYKAINKDIPNSISANSNGIFINFNILSDNCINEILEHYNKYINESTIPSVPSTNIRSKLYNMDNVDIITQLGHKLSNQEKIIIKREHIDN